MNLISAATWGFTGAIAIIIFILIVVNRAQYTDKLRNKRYWNKKRFDGKGGEIPSICPTVAPAASASASASASAPATMTASAPR